MDPEEAFALAGKLLELVGSERGPRPIVEAMLLLAAEISASHPETIGPPYFLHIVTRGASCGRDVIEEQFRRAVASVDNRALSARSI